MPNRLTGANCQPACRQLQQPPALIALGCAMGYLRSATSSIYPGIATHALLNLTSVALAVTVTA